LRLVHRLSLHEGKKGRGKTVVYLLRERRSDDNDGKRGSNKRTVCGIRLDSLNSLMLVNLITSDSLNIMGPIDRVGRLSEAGKGGRKASSLKEHYSTSWGGKLAKKKGGRKERI